MMTSNYAYNPNSNKLQLSLTYGAVNSSKVEFWAGEWIIVTLEAHSSNLKYSLII